MLETDDDVLMKMDSIVGKNEKDIQRFRKQADKGREYNLDRMKSHFKALVSSWNRKYRVGGIEMTDATNSSALRELRSSINETFEKAVRCVEDIERETTVDKAILDKLEALEENHTAFLTVLNQRIIIQMDEEGRSQKSRKSSISHSSRSSRKSSASSVRSVISDRAEAAQRAARLRAKLDNAQKIADAKVLIDKLRIETELKGEEARLEILDAEMEGKEQIDQSLTTEKLKKTTCEPNEDITTTSLITALKLSRLPVAEPDIFKGDCLEYPSWVASFDLLINTNNVPPAEQLFYLKKYVAGEPKEMLEGYFMLRKHIIKQETCWRKDMVTASKLLIHSEINWRTGQRYHQPTQQL